MAQTVVEPKTQNIALSSGLRMRYYEWPGKGPNLIFLHPSSGYGRMWEYAASYLNGSFHLFALDQRGHGDTDRPDGDYSAEEYADDLHLFINELKLGKAIIAGHSLGGRVGQVYAATYPSQILALLLVGGPHYSNFFQERGQVKSVLDSVMRMRDSVTEFANEEAALAYLRQNRAADSEESHRHRIQHNMRQLPTGRFQVKYDSLRVAQGLTHMANSLRRYAQKTKCPVAIIRGAKGTHLTRDEATRMAAFWKDVQIVDVEGDYTLELENPAGLAQAIREFVKTKVAA